MRLNGEEGKKSSDLWYILVMQSVGFANSVDSIKGREESRLNNPSSILVMVGHLLR